MKKLMLLTFLVATGCSPEIAVRSDYDKDVNLKKYSTYKWAEMTDLESKNNPLYYNELTDKRIRAAVNTELQARGYSQTEDHAELIVHYHIIVENQGMIRSDPYGNYGPYWMRPQTVVQYKEGTIIIDVMESETNNLAWRGWATSVLDGILEINDELINNSVSKLFKKYPWQAPQMKPVGNSKPLQ